MISGRWKLFDQRQAPRREALRIVEVCVREVGAERSGPWWVAMDSTVAKRQHDRRTSMSMRIQTSYRSRSVPKGGCMAYGPMPHDVQHTDMVVGQAGTAGAVA